MMMPDMRTREAKAAQLFMERKGYPEAKPHSVIKIEDQKVWYYYYQLPEGILELEVTWVDGSWTWHVTAFRMDDKKEPCAVPVPPGKVNNLSASRYLVAH